jgi:hypothetical protein
MTTKYNRSEILSFFDLTEAQQEKVKSIHDYDGIEESSFVIHEGKEQDILPLSMFMRCDKNNFTHGIYSTSIFDGYFLTFNRSNDEAVIAHKYF